MDASSSSYAAVAAAVDVEPAPKQQQQCIVTKPAQQQQKRKRADGDMGLQMSGLAGRQSMVRGCSTFYEELLIMLSFFLKKRSTTQISRSAAKYTANGRRKC